MKLKVLVCFAIIFMIVVTACTNNSNRQIPESGTTEAKTSVELVVKPVTTGKWYKDPATTTAETTIAETPAETTTVAETTTEKVPYYENTEFYKKTSVNSNKLKEWGIEIGGVKISKVWLYKAIIRDDVEAFESDIIVIEVGSNSEDFIVSLEGAAELLENKLIRISHQCSIFTSGKTLKLKGFSEDLRKITLSTSQWNSIVYNESVNASTIIFKFQ